MSGEIDFIVAKFFSCVIMPINTQKKCLAILTERVCSMSDILQPVIPCKIQVQKNKISARELPWKPEENIMQGVGLTAMDKHAITEEERPKEKHKYS